MNELYHYGMPRRSGRYPYGSGERPFQSLRERSAAKNLKIGKERLTNRINRANKLADDERTRSLGRYTKWVRVGTVAGSLAVGGSAFVTTVLGLPIAAAGATAKIGYDYFKKTKY